MSLSRKARNNPWPSGVMPGTSSANPTASSTSSTFRNRPFSPGSRMNRSTRSGTSTSALICVPSSRPRFHNHGQRAIGDERKGMRRVDRDRRQNRKQPVDKQLPEPRAVVARQRFVVENGNALGTQAFLQIGPAALLSLNQTPSDFGDRGQLLIRGQSVIALHGNSAGRQFVEAGDPHHVEFVEVAIGDRQEPHPLEQRMTRTARLLENALVKGQPGQLAVDVAL